MAPPISAAVRHPATVLLVDDDRAVRRALERILRRYGYGVVSAGSGEEALERLAEERDRIDVLLTDLVMPGVGGRELGRLALARKTTLKVIYMSAFAPDEVLREGPLTPAHEFLRKPFTIDSLLARLGTSLGSKV